MSKIQQSKHKYMWLMASQLEVHPKVQRAFSSAHAMNIAKNFKPDAVGELQVVPAPRGKYYVWDGQHRLAAIRDVSGPDVLVRCRVWVDLKQRDLAALQVDFNTNSKRWNAVPLFHQKLLQGDPLALAINKQVVKRNMRVYQGGDEGQIAAAAALEGVTKTYGIDVLSDVLDILMAAWGRDANAYCGVFLRGMAHLVGNSNGDIDNGTLSAKLKKRWSAAAMQGEARSVAKALYLSGPMGFADLCKKTYNRGRAVKNRIA